MMKSNYTPFHAYSKISNMMAEKGYECRAHTNLIKSVKIGDERMFMEALVRHDNEVVRNARSDNAELNCYEKMISVWKKKSMKCKSDIDYRVLVYFANTPDDQSNVNKEETTLMYQYMIHAKVTATIFVHINKMSTTSGKQLTLSQLIPSTDLYKIDVIQISTFDLNIGEHFYVPKHVLIKNTAEFYKREKIVKGTLQKINRDDPAIVFMGASPGDIVEITRMEDFEGIEKLAYREVSSSKMEIVPNGK